MLAFALWAPFTPAVADAAAPGEVYACAAPTGTMRVIDAAAACNPGEQRLALAVARPPDGNEDLWRNLALLVATAITSGLLVPYVLGRIDYQRSEHARERQTRVARESKVIDSQVRLLDSLSRIMWRWRYLVIKVTYYGQRASDPRYETARQEYDVTVWDVLNQFRIEVSRSQRLTSESVHTMLRDFYQLMVDTDNRLRDIQEASDDAVKLAIAYSDLNHEVFHNVSARIDAILDDAAREMGLRGAGAVKQM